MDGIATQAAQIIQPAAGAGSSLLSGLLHWCELDEPSGDAIDSHGGVIFTETNGTVGYSATGGPDGGPCRVFTDAPYFEAAAGDVWASNTAVTWGVWVWIDPTSGGAGVFNHQAPNGYTRLFHTAGPSFYYYFDGALRRIESTTASEWHCAMATSTGPGGDDELWLDGVSLIQSSRGFEPGSSQFFLGSSTSGSLPMAGRLAVFATWDRVLTSAEIAKFSSFVRYSDL